MAFLEKIREKIDVSEEENKKEKKKKVLVTEENEEKEPQEEGELAIDLYETEKEIILESPIAGVKGEDLEILIENDILVIRGERKRLDENKKEQKKYLYQECYWGPFSRKIILPDDIDISKVEAKIKNGILVLKLPKIQRKTKKKIIVVEE